MSSSLQPLLLQILDLLVSCETPYFVSSLQPFMLQLSD